MLQTIIRENSYQDSITLMLLSKKLSTAEGVNKVSIMMGTPANKDIMAASGLGTPELDKAKANDIAIVMDLTDSSIVPLLLQEVDTFLSSQSAKNTSGLDEVKVTSWEKAFAANADANLVMLSIPGEYVEIEAETALNAGKHVFIFSDNVPLEVEKRLKDKAAALGLLVMGPDCGTALIGGLPLAFTNVVPAGNIGMVGASGTGLQEVSTQIARLGGGVSQIIGTGGRDVSTTINGSTMKSAIAALAHDPATTCIVVIGKPPAPSVKDEVMAMLRASSKPAVVHFVGEQFTAHEERLYYANTLEEAARLAVCIARGEKPIKTEYTPAQMPVGKAEGKKLRGLYTGGTLAGEAAAMLARAMKVDTDSNHTNGFMLHHDGHQIVDLGDDVYTKGRPHPMIDPQTRLDLLAKTAADTSVGVVLLDLVLGYGAHTNMAETLATGIREAVQTAKAAGNELIFIASVCGTEQDPQGLAAQTAMLTDAGVIVAPSNASAVATALRALGYTLDWPTLSVSKGHPQKAVAIPAPAAGIADLLQHTPVPVNVGVKDFVRPFMDMHRAYVQFDWRPLAGGDVELQKIIAFLNNYSEETRA